MHLIRRTTDKPFLRGNVVKLSSIRKQSAPYILIWILYYAWVVAFATWWTASPFSETVFSTQLRGLMHSVNLVSSAVFVFVIRKEWFIKTSRIGAVIIAVGMAAFFVIPDERVRILSAVISSIAVGCVNIGILIPFVFTLNNTEKLYAVVGSNALIQLISLFQEHSAGSGMEYALERIISFGILGASLCTVMFFHKADATYEAHDRKTAAPEFHRRIYLTIFFNCAIAVLCKGAGKGILNMAAAGSSMPLLMWHYVGGLIGCLLFVFVYAYTRRAFLWLGNITFLLWRWAYCATPSPRRFRSLPPHSRFSWESATRWA